MGRLLVPGKSPVRLTASPAPSLNRHTCWIVPPLYRLVNEPLNGMRTKASVAASALAADVSNEPSLACASGSSVRTPVAGSMSVSCSLGSVLNLSVALMIRPSGVHPTTLWRAPSNVSRLGRPPDIGITYTSAGPSYSPMNATCVPSGEMEGANSSPGWLVSRVAVPPTEATFHRSPSETKTSTPCPSAGIR